MEGKGNIFTSQTSFHIVVVLVTLLFLSNMDSILAFYNSTGDATKVHRAFIKEACNTTIYSSLCYKSLIPYDSTIQTDPFILSNISLSVALKATQRACSTVSKLKKMGNLTTTETEILQDCEDNVEASIQELEQSIEAMAYLDGIDKEFQMSNIKTWVSAAITDEETCLDEFEEQYVSYEIKLRIRETFIMAERMTSNALALINNLGLQK